MPPDPLTSDQDDVYCKNELIVATEYVGKQLGRLLDAKNEIDRLTNSYYQQMESYINNLKTVYCYVSFESSLIINATILEQLNVSCDHLNDTRSKTLEQIEKINDCANAIILCIEAFNKTNLELNDNLLKQCPRPPYASFANISEAVSEISKSSMLLGILLIDIKFDDWFKWSQYANQLEQLITIRKSIDLSQSLLVADSTVRHISTSLEN
ncbi:hypothetical protein ACOME3_008994 [Neoechinorhynchus agilis]